jgi:hypothetical protein
MIRKVAGVMLACGLFAVAVSGADFQTYKFAAGRFQAAFPGKPKLQNQPTRVGLTGKNWSVELADRAYAVIYCDLPDFLLNEPDAKIQQRLDSAVRGIVNVSGGTVTKQSRVWLNGKHPGRDFQINMTRPKVGVVRGQMYLVGSRLYQVLLIGTSAAATSADADRFLNSFALTK